MFHANIEPSQNIYLDSNNKDKDVSKLFTKTVLYNGFNYQLQWETKYYNIVIHLYVVVQYKLFIVSSTSFTFGIETDEIAKGLYMQAENGMQHKT